MRDDTFFDYVYNFFYKFSEVKPEDFGIVFSRNTTYPLLESIRDSFMVIPIPKIVNEKYVYEGMVFENTPEDRRNMWSLFLATIYHLAGHVATLPYAKYQKWVKRKTPETCWRVIDFIEDILSERYIYHKDEEVWKNLVEVEKRLRDNDMNRPTTRVGQLASGNTFQTLYGSSKIGSIKEEIIQNIGKNDFEEKLLSIATSLYEHNELIHKVTLPFQDHHKPSWSPKVEQPGLKFEPFGIFDEQIEELDRLWEINVHMKNKILKRYHKYLKNLHFDSIVIPPGNIQEYEKLKSQALPMLRRIRQQLRLVSNLIDEPRTDQIGYIDMQMAIQAIASEGASNEIFERDEQRRGEEAWVILIDKSASMQLRFDRLKEFAVTLSESANELTGKSDAWALYSFDNNFYILKDFKEKFNQEIKARIGSIEKGGLSLLPDAIELASRALADDQRDRKFIFVITDGHPSGYEKVQEAFSKTMKKTEISGITLVGIGVTKAVTHKFRNSARATDLKELVIKFITAYKTAASTED